MGKLTAKRVQAAKYAGKVLKLSDGNGLYLHVTATGKKWRYRYRLNGTQREYTIGPVELIGLADARDLHRVARSLVLEGKDPVQERRHTKQALVAEQARAEEESVDFNQALNDWLRRYGSGWAPNTRRKNESRLRAIPQDFLNRRLIDITTGDIQNIVDDLESRGRVDMARRLFKLIRSILSDNKQLQLTACPDDVKLSRKPAEQRFAHTTKPAEIAQILIDSKSYSGPVRSVWVALNLLPMLGCRPGELRNLQWDEIDFERSLAVIPAERMKAGERHVIPLATQALKLLQEHRLYCDARGCVLPGLRAGRPISDNTINVAYRNMGYKITAHGWRHTFSTLLNEGNAGHWHPDAIEIQLAHKTTGVRGRYNSAERLSERMLMMQAWADYLDSLRTQGFQSVEKSADLCV